jgi:hypothetical protein
MAQEQLSKEEDEQLLCKLWKFQAFRLCGWVAG